MKFSYVTLPDYPLADSIEMIKTADRLGYHAVYSVDETWHKDPWILFAAAADKTEKIRFGPNLTPIGLREPTLVCQALATLDELTGGRTECVFSIGNFGLLAQYHIDWAKTQAAVEGQGGASRDADVPRRGRHHLRRRVLQLLRPVHVRAAGAGAGPADHRRDARPQVVPGRGRDLGRLPSRSLVLEGGLRVPRREREDRRRAGRSELAGPGHRRLVRHRLRARLGRGEAHRPHDGGLLHLLDATRAARAPRDRRRPTWRRSSRRSARASSTRRSS